MGSCFSLSDRVEPDQQELNGKHDGDASTASVRSFESIVSSRYRSCTDVFFLVLLGLFTISLLGLIIYCATNGDINRIINGYDSCGNVCGRQNLRNSDSAYRCEGVDYRKKPYLLIESAGRNEVSTTNLHRLCVDSCSDYQGYVLLLNRCVPKRTQEVTNSVFSKTGITDFLAEASEDLQLCWREILYMCLLALLFSVVILLLYRFAAAFVIWAVLITLIVITISVTVFLWIRYVEVKNERVTDETGAVLQNSDVEERSATTHLYLAILATVVTIIIVLVIIFLRKRIKLVAQLFIEAGKAVSSMPFLFFEPILTFVALGAIAALWLSFALIIESSGRLRMKDASNEDYEFKKDGAMKFTRWYNVIGFIWFIQFVIACQQMIVAGAVAKWYFTRNKDNLGYPILNSFKLLTRFHLGTVSFGSLIITIVQIIRALLKYAEKSARDSNNMAMRIVACFCQCCLAKCENIIQYLSRNAYIITAMYGYPFCRSGKTAFSLLMNNAMKVFAINSIGDFVLFLSKVLIVLATFFSGYGMVKDNASLQHMWLPIAVGCIFAMFISHAFICIYEMVIDTIFLCFCEDCKDNDGLSRPYYMSRGLMEFVENSKKLYAIPDTPTTVLPPEA